jgi:error-prone DNA polymerase
MRYAELHCKTNFSFLESASHAEELVLRAAELGYRALAVTDRDSLASVVRAHIAAKEIGLPLVIGAEITPLDAPPVVLWATDRASYGRLCRLITRGRRQAEKGQCLLALADVAEFAEGIIAGVVVKEEELQSNGSQIAAYRDLFPDRCYLLAELHRGADDAGRLAELQKLSGQLRMPLVAAGDVHYHVAGRIVLYDVLTAIRHGTTVAAAEGTLLFPNAERHLRSLEEIRALFAAAPDAIARTVEIAERCRFSLDELRYEYPTELAPAGRTPLEYLTELAWQGAAERYPSGVPEKVRAQIEHELALIGDLHYESYFLTVWDLVRFARSRNILCQGRGSAANSAVCYCLGVTSVNPATSDLLFERFISRERAEAPDIDVDFEHERREEVLQYLYDKYGRERAGLAATVITYCSRSAVRDVGKALGLSLDRVDVLAKQVEGYTHEPKLVQRCREVGIDAASDVGRRLVYCVNEIIGFPRHLSQHVGGMVMTQGPLCELVPIENAAMADRTVIQWDKDDLDELGILKVDCLCLGMLTAIHKCFDMVREHYSTPLPPPPIPPLPPGEGRGEGGSVMRPATTKTLATIPPDDPAVYDMICRADTLGVFQIESRAQMSMLPRLRPRCFYDLVIEVAIVRPGPIQGNMVHPFLRRRMGEEEVTYPNDAIRDVLHKTLGVPIFQEQAMRLAVVAAGFTPGEADQLRRAMAAWRRPGIIDQFRKKLLDGMRANGLTEEFAQNVYHQIRGFGEYGFPESHAASFALLVYVSAWLKHYYPAAFCAAMINSQPLGFYAPAQLVRDAREHGVEVRPVDVNHSGWDCRLEANDEARMTNDELQNYTTTTSGHSSFVIRHSRILRLGLRMINGLRANAAAAIERAREDGPFTSIDDFARRTGLSQAVVKRLAEADAFGSLGAGRRQALWDSLGQERNRVWQPLLDILPLPPGEGRGEGLPPGQNGRAMYSAIPAMPPYEEVVADYRSVGLSLKAHPISFYRQQLNRLKITPAKALTKLHNGAKVRVAGLVLLRQRPSTAKGITFVTLEDETGTINLVVHQHTWDRFYRIARRAPAWIAHGHVQTTGDKEQTPAPVIHVVVSKLEALADQLRRLDVKSRDFR